MVLRDHGFADEPAISQGPVKASRPSDPPVTLHGVVFDIFGRPSPDGLRRGSHHGPTASGGLRRDVFTAEARSYFFTMAQAGSGGPNA